MLPRYRHAPPGVSVTSGNQPQLRSPFRLHGARRAIAMVVLICGIAMPLAPAAMAQEDEAPVPATEVIPADAPGNSGNAGTKPDKGAAPGNSGDAGNKPGEDEATEVIPAAEDTA